MDQAVLNKTNDIYIIVVERRNMTITLLVALNKYLWNIIFTGNSTCNTDDMKNSQFMFYICFNTLGILKQLLLKTNHLVIIHVTFSIKICSNYKLKYWKHYFNL